MTQGRAGNRQMKLAQKFGRTGIEQCPVCGIKNLVSTLSRHIMNSRGNKAHEDFMAEQDQKILAAFDDADCESFSVEVLAFLPGVFCSTAHVRKLLNQFRPAWRDKARTRRKLDTERQYVDGRRKKATVFGNGWKASKELGTGNYMSRQKRDAIIRAFSSDKKIKEVAAETACKAETVIKVWREEFSESEYKARLDRTWRFLKPSLDSEKSILALFESDISCNEIARQFGTAPAYIKSIWEKVFGKEAYRKRAGRMRKLGILKSYEIMGRMTSSGLGSQPEFACFKKLADKFGDQTVHHDMDSLEPFELDISIPSRKLAVLWDGPSHRRPIFGQKKLEQVQRRDIRKQQQLVARGWTVVVVEDECRKFKHFDMDAVADKIVFFNAPGVHRVIVGEHGELQ